MAERWFGLGKAQKSKTVIKKQFSSENLRRKVPKTGGSLSTGSNKCTKKSCIFCDGKLSSSNNFQLRKGLYLKNKCLIKINGLILYVYCQITQLKNVKQIWNVWYILKNVFLYCVKCSIDKKWLQKRKEKKLRKMTLICLIFMNAVRKYSSDYESQSDQRLKADNCECFFFL